jgi:hypothetical protein
MFHDALVRVLHIHEFDVVDGDGNDSADVAVVSEPVGEDTWDRALIQLPPGDGSGGCARVVTPEGASAVEFSTIGELIDVIREHAAVPFPAV